MNPQASIPLSIVPVPEDTAVLNSRISMSYPVPPEIQKSSDAILALLSAAQKYDMVAIQSSIRAEASRRALRHLAEFRTRCASNLYTQLMSFLDERNGPSKIWVGCPAASIPERLPGWLESLLRMKLEQVYDFTYALPTPLGLARNTLRPSESMSTSPVVASA
jgi:hypothetical protein